MRKSWFIIKIIKMVVLGALFIALAVWAFMSLWNWLIPEIFGLTTITWIQAVGLLALSKIMFGGIGGKGGGGGMRKHYWKHKFKEKWQGMSPEQREKWNSHFDKHCGPKKWMDKAEEKVEVQDVTPVDKSSEAVDDKRENLSPE